MGGLHAQIQSSIPPELLKPFDMSLLESNEKIPAGNASSVAPMNELCSENPPG